jgi:N-acetylglutamate synthase-like GNAT family acetyltransferase
MSNIEIKVYAEPYKEQIIQQILKIQVEEFGVPITIKDQPDLESISTFYQKGTGNFWVAKSDNQVIGTIALLDIGNSQCALRKMFVAKEYRGKEKGVAQRLLTALIDWCKSKKITEVYLGTVATYLAAHRFYEKNHFQEISPSELPESFPRMTVDTKFYKLSL